MSRAWNQLQNYEIFAIWNEYLRYEGLTTCDSLAIDRIQSKPMRLTPIDIIRLVSELLDRLEVKESSLE